MRQHIHYVKSHNTCLLCQREQLRKLPGYEKDHLCKCQACGFVFSKVIPTEQELMNHYNGYGRNDYLSPITVKRYEELLEKFEPFRQTNRILDWGCGIGYFLEVAKRKGWDVHGTEFTDDAVRICRDKGIKVYQGALDKVNLPDGYFDIITSFEVIEHIYNPITEIGKLDRLLRHGGLMYHTTPNFNSLLRYYLKGDYNVISYPEHLSYYTPKTISKLFESLGYRKRFIKTTGISLSRFKKSRNKSNEKPISSTSTDEKIRLTVESKWYMQLIKTLVNKILTVLGVGDSIKAMYQKSMPT